MNDLDFKMELQNKSNRVTQYLDDQNIVYERLTHRRDYTARQAASDCALEPSGFAKVVAVVADGGQILLVLPADHQVDMERLKGGLGAGHVALLPESAFCSFFPDCEVGAFPPLGNLYGLPVYVAPDLARQQMIAFNACSHEQAIRMAYKDFDHLVRPIVLDFSYTLSK